jgi:Fic family protein
MNNINELVRVARSLAMSSTERDEQRRNFAFGSSNIENARITRDTVTRAENELRQARDTSRIHKK